MTTLVGERVASLCLDCDAQLPLWWGCDRCEYETVSSLAGVCSYLLTVPCAEHAAPLAAYR